MPSCVVCPSVTLMYDVVRSSPTSNFITRVISPRYRSSSRQNFGDLVQGEHLKFAVEQRWGMKN